MVGLLAAAAGMIIALVIDILGARMGAERVTAYAVSFFAGLSAAVLTAILLPGQLQLATLCIATLTYATWWFTFLNLVQALASSLRVRLLQEVRAAGGRISRAALHTRYNDMALLSLRLDRLRSHGAIVEVAQHLLVASSGLRIIALFFRTLKKLLTGRVSEFGAPPA